MSVLATLAMALDTLPTEGRMLLLALLLATALYWFARLLPQEPGSMVNMLYRKGALVALLAVPLMVYLLGLQVPVPVDEIVQLQTSVPAVVATGVLGLWMLGVMFFLYKVFIDLQATFVGVARHRDAHGEIQARTQHWQLRLNLRDEIRVVCGDAEQAWHVGGFIPWQKPGIVLPAAALNWPVGVVDVMLLVQMAQLNQNCWRWLVFGRCVQALYWPLPWVGRMVQELARSFEYPAHKLAHAAYRDPEGWRRDARNLSNRAATLNSIEGAKPGQFVRLANTGEVAQEPSMHQTNTPVAAEDFALRYSLTKTQKQQKARDPYEQVYWLIAVASILVGVSTTLTLTQKPPEFEPKYLHIKWQDQMVRRPPDQSQPPAQQD